VKAALMLAGMFLLGGVAGVAVGRLSALHDLRRMVEGPPAEARVNFRVEVMRRHLDLSPDQVVRVRAVMEQIDAEREKLMAACSPGMEELRQRADAQLREILNEEQRRRFDEMRAHHRHGNAPWMGPPPPPPDGPHP
jgi:hypothetical protein